MTTFSGSTIPPIFTGGGGSDEFTSGTVIQETTNNAAPIILPPAPDIQAGDQLLVMAGANGGLAQEPTENPGPWQVIQIGNGGNTRLFRRIASGDANDNFTCPTNIGGDVYQMGRARAPTTWFGPVLSLENNVNAADLPFLGRNALTNRDFDLPILIARKGTNPAEMVTITGNPTGAPWIPISVGQQLFSTSVLFVYGWYRLPIRLLPTAADNLPAGSIAVSSATLQGCQSRMMLVEGPVT